jgi:hypothetical protein
VAFRSSVLRGLCPELVIHGTDGKVQSVRYLELTALLLNELQKQTAKIAAQQREIDALSKRRPASMRSASGSRHLSGRSGRQPRRNFARSPANKHLHSAGRLAVKSM